ncbi:MAG: DUF4388 domain-containing protein, partial [Candidatus Sumerlaeia bacterium]|nr:DUF4388 domain-containing protein [Candidatus Sumerlaeia bacterium]
LDRQRRLGDLLIHRGILKRSDLTKVLNLQRTAEPNKKLGQLLVEHDFIRETQIREVLRIQLEEEIWNLFGLEEGEFRFEQILEKDLGDLIVEIDIDPLLLEGTRRQDEWRNIVRVLPSDRIIPAISPPESREAQNRFSPLQWKVLSQVNGRFPIRAIINRAGLGRFEVYQTLYDLIQSGVIYIRKEDQIVKTTTPGLSGNDDILDVNREALAPVTPKGVSGLLSRLTGGRREDRQEKLKFQTPIGLVTAFNNRLLEQLGSTDPGLGARLWMEMLISFPKADLITVKGTRLYSDQLEEFLAAFEMTDAVTDVFEDTMEALVGLADGLFRMLVQRAGEKSASKAVREVLEDMAERCKLTFVPDFRLDERLRPVLKLGN